MKENGFTAFAVSDPNDVNPLPMENPPWTSVTVTGCECDEESSDCFHYLPDDISTGSVEWLFRESEEDTPFDAIEGSSENVPSLLFIR